MEVYRNGTRAKTVLGDIECIIIGILIRGEEHVQYEVSYFATGSRKKEVLDSDELKLDKDAKTKTIGYIDIPR